MDWEPDSRHPYKPSWWIWCETRGSDNKPDWGQHNVHRLKVSRTQWEIQEPEDLPTSYSLTMQCKKFPGYGNLLDADRTWYLYRVEDRQRLTLQPTVEQVTEKGATDLVIVWWSPVSFTDNKL